MKKTFSWIFFFLLAARAFPSEGPVTIDGYIKSFSLYLHVPVAQQGAELLEDMDLGAANNRLRIGLRVQPSRRMSFELEYDISPRIQDPLLFEESFFAAGLKPLEYRIKDFRDRLYPAPGKKTGSFGLFHNLDRILFTFHFDLADISVGRQAIAWGSGRLINPTDILAPFGFNELDKEERRGVDAVRVKIPLGSLEELDIGFVAGANGSAENNAFFLRGKANFLKTDLSALVIRFRNHLLFGFDLTRALGGAGVWLEAAYVLPDIFREIKRPAETGYFRVTAGMDTNLSGTIYVHAEYHYNSAGENQPESYLQLYSRSPYQEGSVYLLGRHYLLAGATCQVHPLVPISGIFILNLNDRSLMLAPSIEYNIAENIYLTAGAFFGLGKRPERVLGPSASNSLLYHSEFGAYPDLGYAAFRVYF